MLRRSLLRPLIGFTAAASALGASPAAASPSPAAANGQRAERASFIVTLRPGTDAVATAGEWRGRGAEISHVYSHALAGFAGPMGPELAEQLRGDGRVVRVERDGVVQISDTQATATWGLDRIDQRSRPLDGSYTYDHSGAGVIVYVIDTGVRATHAEFAGRVESGYTAIGDGYGTNDCHGHGTHVAGTVAGTTYGTAKAVTVVPVRVLDCDGWGTMSGALAGVDWVTAHHTSGLPAVANMSLVGGANSSLDSAVRNSITDGIIYSVAAGNDNIDACTQSPARVGEALTAAASTSTDVRASFSNWGSCVDLFGPGSAITSSHHRSDTATATMSGTSMAAPHVAGLAALYLSGHPSASADVVSAAIVEGATANVMSDTAGSPNRLAYSRLAPTNTPPATVVVPPAAPAAPTATAGKRAVTAAWTAPTDGGSPITAYNARAHRASDGTVVKAAKVSGSTRSVTIGGLSAGTTYYVTVQATNAAGSSSWSPPSNDATPAR